MTSRVDDLGWPTIETDRLLLALISPADAGETAQLVDAAVSRNLSTWPPRMDAEEARDRIARSIATFRDRKSLDLSIRLKQDGRLAGWIGIWQADRLSGAGRLGYWIGSQFAGAGLISEAIDPAIRAGASYLGLRVVEACSYPRNRASIRILEKYGFVFVEERQDYSPVRKASEPAWWYRKVLGGCDGRECPPDGAVSPARDP